MFSKFKDTPQANETGCCLCKMHQLLDLLVIPCKNCCPSCGCFQQLPCSGAPKWGEWEVQTLHFLKYGPRDLSKNVS